MRRMFNVPAPTTAAPWLAALCAFALLVATGAAGAADGVLGKTVVVSAQDEYAGIDVAKSAALLRLIQQGDARARETALAEARANPNAYIPPVLFEVAKDLYARNQPEEATYWYALARMRAVNDSDILVDTSAAQGVGTLIQTYRDGFAAYVPQHMPVVWEQMNRAADWDRANPPAYDRRWLALHGIRAVTSALEKKEGVKRGRDDITISRDEWAARDEANRADMLAKMKAHLDRAAPASAPDEAAGPKPAQP